MSDGSAAAQSGVFVSMPLPDYHVFRYQAADDILELLYRNPHKAFTITQLRNITGHGGKSVDNAIKILASLNLIERKQRGRQSLVSITQSQIKKPDDPILEIPQKQFRKPVKSFLEDAMLQQKENLVAVVLFGSVARGEADRASDIDLQVIVEGDLVAARRDLQEVRQEIENRRFDGERYNIQLLVESVESAENYGEKLTTILSEGITLHSTKRFERVREVVFDG